MKRIVVLLSSVLLLTTYYLPLTVFGAGEPGGFMYWGAGGRAMGMGNASVGAVNDAFALYWNPGVLGTLEYKELATFHSILWEDTSFSFVGYAHPTLNKGVFGLSLTRLFSGNADKRDDNNVSVGSFNHSQIALGFSYGRNLYKNIFWGATGKFMSLTLDTFNQNAFTVDSGLYLPIGQDKNPTIGINIQNVISGMLTADTDDQLPIVFKVGTGYKLFGDKLLVAVDLGHKSKTAAIDTYAIGLESAINKLLSVRLGRNQDETTAGFGIKWKNLNIDYAMALHFLGSSHRISFNTKFGTSLSDQRKAGAGEEDTASESDSAEAELSAERFREVFQNAISLYRRGLYKQSNDKFMQAQSIDPKDMDVPLYLDRIGMLVPIVPQVISPDKTSELLRRGITYFIEGDGKSAVKTVAYSLSTEPDNFTISRVLSRIEEKTGFKADYAKPVSGMSTVEQKLFEGLIAFRKKDYDRVVSLCEEVLILEPTNLLAHKRLGSAFFAMGDKEKAIATWQKALDLQPDPKLEEMLNKIKNQK